ncbi:MAG: hypothetical protein JST47_05885, partial [Bacteroidetes bacterium]|nr:hypothetical protein [Bacteroidota bacterium]
MSDQGNSINENGLNGNVNHFPAKDNSWTIGPREFILKYIKYLPWVVISAALGLIFAYIKIRYTTPIYHAQSSMLIKSDKQNNNGDKFAELYLGQSGPNLSNEIPVL